ncbi:MAG: hypothetical protein JSR33_10430, partial [Proteobacteria bacterium]|nr:hypothetical protein [Pseudomonadota bacterium]
MDQESKFEFSLTNSKIKQKPDQSQTSSKFDFSVTALELKEILDEYRFTSELDNCVRSTLPQALGFFSDLANDGYFNRFFVEGTENAPRPVYVLEPGCYCAPLALGLNKIALDLALRNIYVKFNYLGIDIVQPVIQELQEQFSEQKAINFKVVNGAHAPSVRTAMDEVDMDQPDIVLFRRPVTLGMNLNQWIFPMTVLLAPIAAAFNPDKANIGVALGLSYMAARADVMLTGDNYNSFYKMLAGDPAKHYEGATVIVTNHFWLEQWSTSRILKSSYRGQLNYGSVYDYEAWSAEKYLRMEKYFTVIDNYRYQPQSLILPKRCESLSYSEALIFFLAARYVLRGKTLSSSVTNSAKLAGVLQFAPFVVEILYTSSPIIIPSIIAAAIYKRIHTVKPSFTMAPFLLLLAHLPLAGSITYSEQTPVSSSLNAMVLMGAGAILAIKKVFNWLKS